MNENQAVEIHAGRTPVEIDNTLTDSTRRRIRESVPESTRRVYAGDWRRFTEWCDASGRTPLPAAPTVIADYADHLANTGRAPSTIERALAAISVAHAASGRDKPNLKPARAALKTYRRERAEAGHSVRKAAPVTIDVLRALIDTCSRDTAAGIRDRALLVLGFALGARRSEIAALNQPDLKDSDDGLTVTIRTSKTDRDSSGREVAIPYGSHAATCPVRTVRIWRDLLAAHGRASGPLFLRIDRHDVIGRASTGRGEPDGRLTGQAVALVVRRAALAAGLDPSAAWSGHSLRRGFATETYRHGANALRIARHGGWKDGSATLLGYVEEVDKWKSNPLSKVGL